MTAPDEDPANPFAAPDPVLSYEYGIEQPPDLDGYPPDISGPYPEAFARRMCQTGSGNTLLQRLATTTYTDWNEIPNP
jgi:hypothetical protein